MNNQSGENLEKLLEKLLNPEQAAAAKEDIRKGDEIFEKNRAPAPDGLVVAGIKNQISKRLQKRRLTTFTLREVRYKAATVAAIVVLLVFIGGRFFIRDKEAARSVAQELPRIIWESTSPLADDAAAATLAAEIEEIESNILAVRLGENESESVKSVNGSTVDEVEMEMVAMYNDFWKG